MAGVKLLMPVMSCAENSELQTVLGWQRLPPKWLHYANRRVSSATIPQPRQMMQPGAQIIIAKAGGDAAAIQGNAGHAEYGAGESAVDGRKRATVAGDQGILSTVK